MVGRVEASSANWEELKPWGDSRGFQVVAAPCSTIAHWQEHHTGQDICTIWAKNQKLLKRALLLMGEESRCQAESGEEEGVGKRLSAHFAHTRRTPLGTPGEFCTLPDKYKFRAHFACFAPGASAHIHCLFKQAKSKLPDL